MLKFIELNEEKEPLPKGKPLGTVIYDNCEHLKNAGLLLNDNVVIIDFDNDNANEIKIMNYFEKNYPTLIVTTDKGKHFYYSKPPKTKIKLWVDKITIGGFQVDYRTGKKGYVMVKRNGVMRNSNQELTLDNLPELPFLMYPLGSTQNITPTNMTGYKDGDGRNTSIFNHFCCIRRYYGDDELENVANFVNENIFAEPLDQTELSNTLKSALQYDIKQAKHKKDEDSWMDKAEAIIGELQCVWFENDIMFFDENTNYYSTNLSIVEHYIQNKYRDTANFTVNGIKEVIKQMAVILANSNKQYTRNDTYILCGKQLVNTQTEEVIDNTRSIVTDVIYNHNIMTNEELAQYEEEKRIGWKFLNDISCSNQEVKQVICECLGCMLAPKNHFGKIFIWYGSGANGKSVLVKVMKAIMGDLLTNANILNINDRFALSRAYKGIANVTDDVGVTTIKETGLLKSIVDGSSIEVDRKHLEPINWVPNSQFVMCCNDLPRIQDTTKGMIRRLAFIPFDLELRNNQIDYDLTQKLLGKSPKLDISDQNDNALRYIMTKAIIAYREAYSRGHLTILEKQRELLKDFTEENKDSISLFYDFLLEREGSVDGLCKWLDEKIFNDVFTEYQKFAEVDNKMTQRKFLVGFNRKLPNRIQKKKVTIAGVTYDRYELQ